MTVRELKAIINDLPDNMDVMFEQTNDEFRYSMANEAVVLELNFRESPDGPVLAATDCLVITD